MKYVFVPAKTKGNIFSALKFKMQKTVFVKGDVNKSKIKLI